jgi:hypothetical protein
MIAQVIKRSPDMADLPDIMLSEGALDLPTRLPNGEIS